MRCCKCHGSVRVSYVKNRREVVRSLVELPDGRVACGYSDGIIRVWDVVTGYMGQELGGDGVYGRKVDSLVVWADGGLAAVCEDAIVSVWDPMLLDPPSLVLNPFRDVFGIKVQSSLVVLGDGRLAIGSGSHTEGAVCVWDFGLERSVAELNGHRGCVCYLADLGSGRVVSGSQNDLVVWDLANETKLLVYTPRTVSMQVKCLVVLEDEQVVTGGSDGGVKVWDLGTARYNLGEINIL
jgi:WD40 repeat protein